MLIFSAQPILPPDEKILRIYQDIKNIIKIFTQPSDTRNYQDLVEETTEKNQTIDELKKEGVKVVTVNVTDFEEESEDKAPEKKELGPDSEGLILITSLVTSCIRGLHHCTSKLYSLEILQLLCENCSSETILDRILPYIVSNLHVYYFFPFTKLVQFSSIFYLFYIVFCKPTHMSNQAPRISYTTVIN